MTIIICNLRRAILVSVLLFCLFVSSSSFAAVNNVVAEAVWPQRDDLVTSIMYSEFDGETWSEPMSVYTTKNIVVTPTIATDAHGNKKMIWSEKRNEKFILRGQDKSKNSSDWELPATIFSLGSENLSPSLLLDRDGKFWLFWSSVQGTLSDVYLMKSTAFGSFVTHQKVNADNNVPDIHPFAQLNENGDVVVKWSAFSLLQRDYVEANRTFETPVSGKVDADTMVDKVDVNGVPLPPMSTQNRVVRLHFPDNLLVQSRALYN